MAELYIKIKGVIEHFNESRFLYEKLARERGWSADLEKFMINVPCFLAASDEEAKKKATSALNYVSSVISGSFEVQKKALEETYYKDVKNLAASGINRMATKTIFR